MEIDGCPFPEDRRYDLENEVWLRPLDDGRTAEVGLVSTLSSFAGRFHALTYRPVEGRVGRGRSVATVESVRFTGAVRLPVEGELLERNPALPGRPKLLNDHPYDLGWVVRIRVIDPTEVERFTLEAPSAREALARRIMEARIRCYPAAPDVELYEIGAECSAVLARVDEEIGRRAPKDVLLLVTDDPTSPIELIRWTDRTGHSILAHRRDGPLHHFLLRKESDPKPRVRRAGTT